MNHQSQMEIRARWFDRFSSKHISKIDYSTLPPEEIKKRLLETRTLLKDVAPIVKSLEETTSLMQKYLHSLLENKWKLEKQIVPVQVISLKTKKSTLSKADTDAILGLSDSELMDIIASIKEQKDET